MKVLLVRPATSPLSEEIDRDADALRSIGVEPVSDPYVEVVPCIDPGIEQRVNNLLAALTPGTWLVATSAMGPRSLRALTSGAIPTSGIRAAGVGPATASALRDLGFVDVLTPRRATGSALAEELLTFPPGRAVIPQGSQALPVVAERLRAAGWEVEPVVIYTTRTLPREPETAAELRAGGFAVVVLRAPSAARAVAEFAPGLNTPVLTTGPTTTAEAEALGFTVAAEADDSTSAALAGAIAAFRDGTLTS